MDRDQESDWIRSSQNGDTIAYGKLVNKYQNMVYTLSLRMLKNNQDAQDLCQEVFIKVYRSLNQFSGSSAFGAWLYRITYNESLNNIKKLKRSRETFDVTENEKENWTETKNVLDSIQENDRKSIILKALDQLSTSDRFLILAYYFDELPIKEICSITNLTESNVKIKLHRSRKVLHKILNKPALKENLI
jgi:RNA polymerase sigma-70 factor (ECF subfamily)